MPPFPQSHKQALPPPRPPGPAGAQSCWPMGSTGQQSLQRKRKTQTKTPWWSTVGPGQSGLNIQGEIEGTWPDKAPGLACSCKTGGHLPPALRLALPRLGQEAGRTMGASGGGPALGGWGLEPNKPIKRGLASTSCAKSGRGCFPSIKRGY